MGRAEAKMVEVIEVESTVAFAGDSRIFLLCVFSLSFNINVSSNRAVRYNSSRKPPVCDLLLPLGYQSCGGSGFVRAGSFF